MIYVAASVSPRLSLIPYAKMDAVQDAEEQDGRSSAGASAAEPKNDHRIAMLGLALTATPFLIAAIRVYVVANGDLAVIKALGATLNIQSLLIGTYLNLLPLMLVISSSGFFLRGLNTAKAFLLRETILNFVMGLGLIALGSLLLPLAEARLVLALTVLIAVFATVGYGLGLLIQRRRLAGSIPGRQPLSFWGISLRTAEALGFEPQTREKKQWKLMERIVKGSSYLYFSILTIYTLLVLIFAPGMWLPTESIGIRSQQTAVIGHVLEDKDGRLTVLRRDGAGIQYYESDDVVNRFPCDDAIEEVPAFTRWFGASIRTDKIPVCIGLEE
ncbi:hypothetical protein ACPB67_00050 [Micromonospora taraxaci]|uniref:hypothetical protein n=1 Tax=Micromonospora taraxaci TaxID=1316803 RepID=UPI003C2F5A03